jgi:hypothetical protein
LPRFGILPESIPDYLALVGDAADGFPGLPGWDAKSAAVLVISAPRSNPGRPARAWIVDVASPSRSRGRCSVTALALLFRHLATLRTDIARFDDIDELRYSWRWQRTECRRSWRSARWEPERDPEGSGTKARAIVLMGWYRRMANRVLDCLPIMQL